MALLAALGHLANFGQMVELGQGHAHQREQIRWSRRNFALDAQALKIDVLGAARDDVRGTYDTYVERLDSLLLLNALLLPFALNTLQFSDQFVPGLNCRDREDPETCIEIRHPWIHTFWVYAVGLDLFIPFWSILMLLRCKARLDTWLQQTLDDLQSMRKNIITVVPSQQTGGNASAKPKQQEEEIAEEQQRIVAGLGRWIVEYQDLFSALWNTECLPLVRWATRLLWSSAIVAVALTAFMVWIYLIDIPSEHGKDHTHFAVVSSIGLGAPLAWMAWTSKDNPRLRSTPCSPAVYQQSAAEASSLSSSPRMRLEGRGSPLLPQPAGVEEMALRTTSSSSTASTGTRHAREDSSKTSASGSTFLSGRLGSVSEARSNW